MITVTVHVTATPSSILKLSNTKSDVPGLLPITGADGACPEIPWLAFGLIVLGTAFVFSALGFVAGKRNAKKIADQIITDEINFELGAAEAALAMDDFGNAAKHNSRAVALMGIGNSEPPMDAGDDPCQQCPIQGCTDSHCPPNVHYIPAGGFAD